MEFMCAQTRPQSILSSKRVLGEWSQNPHYLQGKNPLYQKNSSQRRVRPTTLYQTGQQAQHTVNELFQPTLKSLTQTQSHGAQVLKPPTISFSPDPPLTLWGPGLAQSRGCLHEALRTRLSPEQWMPTWSSEDQRRSCGRLWTSCCLWDFFFFRVRYDGCVD